MGRLRLPLPVSSAQRFLFESSPTTERLSGRRRWAGEKNMRRRLEQQGGGGGEGGCGKGGERRRREERRKRRERREREEKGTYRFAIGPQVVIMSDQSGQSKQSNLSREGGRKVKSSQ
eukprot:765047-Hanusia_phi.AAC.9